MHFSEKEIKKVIFPLIEAILKNYTSNKTLLVGIGGGQGTGKTSLVKYIESDLRERGYRVTSFSLDDFYLSWRDRQDLALKYPDNPFYQISRGMPGTHRVTDLFKALQRAKAGRPFTIPIFDKSLYHGAGDIARKTLRVRTKQDIILFEGWCLGIPLASSQELKKACQHHRIPLSKIDPTLKYHQTVLSLAATYQKIWKLLNYMVMLKPDSGTLHFHWRWRQERELRKRTGKGMNQAEVEKFVSLYLPFTYLCYDKIRSDMLVKINRKHEFYRLQYYS